MCVRERERHDRFTHSDSHVAGSFEVSRQHMVQQIYPVKGGLSIAAFSTQTGSVQVFLAKSTGCP